MLSQLGNTEDAETEKGIPYLFLKTLSVGAEGIEAKVELAKNTPERTKPWDEVTPVFIPVLRNKEKQYLVNYVNGSLLSMEQALGKIKKSKILYIIPSLTIKKRNNGRD